MEDDFLQEDIEPEGVTVATMVLLSVSQGDVASAIAKYRCVPGELSASVGCRSEFLAGLCAELGMETEAQCDNGQDDKHGG